MYLNEAFSRFLFDVVFTPVGVAIAFTGVTVLFLVMVSKFKTLFGG